MPPNKGGYRQINKAVNICAFEDYLEGQQSLLPQLADVEQLTPRVLQLLGQNPGKFTLQGTNTFLVGTGTHRLLIDTGQGLTEWADLISEVVEREEITISAVLLTHWHGDHTGGVPDLIRMYPHLASAIYKHSPTKEQKPIIDGQLFEVEGATIRAVHSPGHSDDHMCFILEEEEAMFTGDNILGHGSSVVEHLGTWMNTLQIMKSHQCLKGYPGHGVVIDNLKARINCEIATRERRERQVLAGLKKQKLADGGRGKGSTTIKDLVKVVHGPDVDATVREMALEPFMDEVLRKLAEDGVVAFEIRQGVKKWFAFEMYCKIG